MQYVQGVGSFSTFDEFLRLTYGDKHWQSSTRVVYSSSPNDYKYRNRDKKENIYDEDKNIIGSYYPTERNRSGAYKDLHVLQEIYYNTGEGDKFGLKRLVYQFQPGTGDAQHGLRERHGLREPPKGADVSRRPLVGSRAGEMEGRCKRRLYTHMDGL